MRSALGDSLFHTLFEQGKILPWEDALAFDQDGSSPRPTQASHAEPRAGVSQADAGNLSARELAILRLVGQGKSNPQIADELFLSVNTEQAHLLHIYAKLGVASRTEAVAFALRHGLA